MPHAIIQVPDPKQAAEAKLLHKLEAWLQAQPEYPMLFLDDRRTRRRVAKEVADRIYMMPKRGRGGD